MSKKTVKNTVFGAITAFFAGVLSFLFFEKKIKANLVENQKSEKEIEKESAKAKEEKENEIKNTDSSNLAANSTKSDDIQSGKEGLQKSSTDRIRNRLGEIL